MGVRLSLYNDVFSLGYLFCAFALSALATGVASPVTGALSVSPRKCAMLFFSLFLLGAVEPYAAAIALLIPAVSWAISMRWTAGALLGALGAVVIGSAIFVLFFAVGSISGVGILGGITAAGLSQLLCYRRIALCAAYGGVAFAAVLSVALETLFGVVLSVPPTAYFDAAVTTAVMAGAACAARSIVRSRKQS